MITDLTGTSWYINNSLTITSTKDYDIVFESRGTTFELMAMDSARVSYDETDVYYSGYGWQYQIHRAITISGGDDVTSQELISWLETNAIQIKVDTLVNTSWIINDVPETMVGSGQYGQGVNLTFNIVGSDTEYSNFTWLERSHLSYRIGPVADQNYLSVYNTSTGWVDSSYKIITITGGSDAAVSFTRGWFQANAVPYVVEPDYIDKVVLTSGDEYYLKDSISGYIAESDLVAGNDIQISSTSEGVSISRVNGGQVKFRFIRYPKPLGPVSDLTGTSWYFNDTLSIDSERSHSYSVNFTTSDIGGYTQFVDLTLWWQGAFSYGVDDTNNITVYYDTSWVSENCRTISITGGEDVTNTELISWLEANATRVS